MERTENADKIKNKCESYQPRKTGVFMQPKVYLFQFLLPPLALCLSHGLKPEQQKPGKEGARPAPVRSAYPQSERQEPRLPSSGFSIPAAQTVFGPAISELRTLNPQKKERDRSYPQATVSSASADSSES